MTINLTINQQTDSRTMPLPRKQGRNDIYSPRKRSEIMSKVRDRDSSAEMTVRSLLHALGYRFRLHRKDLPGSPDIVLPRFRAVIFVHGCFWHQHTGCSRSKLPETNKEFWRNKLNRNVERDEENERKLHEKGWHVLNVWECEIKKRNIPALEKKLHNFLEQ